MELVTYRVLAWIKDGVVRCASQLCDKCPNKAEGRCVPASLTVTAEVEEEQRN